MKISTGRELCANQFAFGTCLHTFTCTGISHVDKTARCKVVGTDIDRLQSLSDKLYNIWPSAASLFTMHESLQAHLLYPARMFCVTFAVSFPLDFAITRLDSLHQVVANCKLFCVMSNVPYGSLNVVWYCRGSWG